jgi:anti-sigma factor RsiW
MNRHHHPEQDRLEDYADGTLSDLERRQLDIHLAQCQVCRDEVTAIRELLSDLRGLPREAMGRAVVGPATPVWPPGA